MGFNDMEQNFEEISFGKCLAHGRGVLFFKHYRENVSFQYNKLENVWK